MAKAANSDELSQAFEAHREETEEQIERLEKVLEMIGKPARGKTCDAMLGLVEEDKEIMEDFKGSVAPDAGLLSAAQAVEHYEISRYGTLKTWAGSWGLRKRCRCCIKRCRKRAIRTNCSPSSLKRKSIPKPRWEDKLSHADL
jgi:ferritin-like metal-binding protein YciE